MTVLDYPEKACPTCGNTMFWYSLTEPNYTGLPTWICGTCVPPPGDITKLKMRVIRGNYILSKRRLEIDNLDDPDQQREERKAWGEGIDKIQQIGKQLKQLTTDCIYIEGGKKVKKCLSGHADIECFTCPNDYWWRQEIEDEWFNKLGQGIKK